ncbi:hypothetical protein [Haloarchaeobius sp. TZWWS8]|uniref:hypothetical protein n=1 Tax=Haloarchaeobius sp. TZWWS8 TaxID=3446121 RepID=UPI003EBDD97D
MADSNKVGTRYSSSESRRKYLKNFTIATSIAASPVVGRVVAANDLSGVYEANDEALYYVTQVGDRIYWAGEATKPSTRFGRGCSMIPFANVLVGSVSNRGATINAGWSDVPKGFIQGQGSMTLRARGRRLSRDSPSVGSGFGGSRWRRLRKRTWDRRRTRLERGETVDGVRLTDIDADSRASARWTRAQFDWEIPDRITGTWRGDDGGTYYIRQMRTNINEFGPNSATVVWFGERDLDWSNVFWGRLQEGERTISGTWVDVPKGRATGRGTLELEIQSDVTLNRTGVTGGFGGRRWNRVIDNTCA